MRSLAAFIVSCCYAILAFVASIYFGKVLTICYTTPCIGLYSPMTSLSFQGCLLAVGLCVSRILAAFNHACNIPSESLAELRSFIITTVREENLRRRKK